MEEADVEGRRAALGNLALTCARLGGREEALGYLVEQEALCQHPGEATLLQACLGNQAGLTLELERYDAADVLLQRAVALSSSLPGTPGLAHHLTNQARLAAGRGSPRATGLADAAERECRRSGSLGALVGCLALRGELTRAAGQWERALRYHDEQERLCRALGRWRELQECLGQQVALYMEHDYKTAFDKLTERASLCQEMQWEDCLIDCGKQRQELMRLLGQA